MVDITETELTELENCFETLQELIDNTGNDPQVQQVMEMIVKCEQIITSKLDPTGEETGIDNNQGSSATGSIQSQPIG